ncbi:S41 family peptidase [Streptomyces sp. NPDC002004]
MSGPDLFPAPRRIRRGAALTLVFAGVLASGFAVGSFDGTPGHGRKVPSPRAGSASLSAAARQQAVADAAAQAMADGKSPTEAAQRAVSRSGDRWGAVYSEGQYEEFERALDGEYTGVGLWARRSADGRIEVTRVQSGGPADRAGIRPGDRLRSVDGERVDGRPVTEAVALLRGDGDRDGAAPSVAGTRVVLGLQRAGRTWTETLRRATLTTDPVSVRRIGDAVLIKIAAFTKGTGERVRSAVHEAPPGDGILLDLRGNSGGLVTEATDAASVFLDGGLVATYDVHGEQRALHARPGGETRRPVVALVDGGTMSAAELLTGALQDRGRAVVVGTRTFGKGSVQMPSRLPDGSVAELTVGHYRTPSGHSVDGRGITPDLEVDQGAERRAERVLGGLGDHA